MTSSLKRLLWLMIMLSLSASSAWATPVGCNSDQTWPLRQTELYWDWQPLTAVPDQWVIRVGLTPGKYTLQAVVGGSHTSIPLTEIISVEQFQKDLAAIGPNATRVVYYSQMAPVIDGKEGDASPSCFFGLGDPGQRLPPVVVMGVRSRR